LKCGYEDDREGILRISLSLVLERVGCEMVRYSLALCLMAGWGVEASGFTVIYEYLYLDVEERNIHPYVTLKRTVHPPMNMAYFQRVSVMLHDGLQRKSHNLRCITKNLCRYSFVATLRKRCILVSRKVQITRDKISNSASYGTTRILQDHSAVM
jgi:hypothetical protein